MTETTLSPRQAWIQDGFFVVRNVFSPDECEEFRTHYEDLNNELLRKNSAWAMDGIDPSSADPLARYPRMVQPHRFDEISLRFLLDPRLRDIMTGALGEEPYCAQTMLYFKPPGARGQALHQDQMYLRVAPGTCLAAWLALDRCDSANGCLSVVPGSHTLPLLCNVEADTERSFTGNTVPVPSGMDVVEVVMEPGDVLFFHGNLIHGSEPNTTPDRFRRSLIGHYATGDAQRIAEFYQPLLRFDGSVVDVEQAEGGGPCGILEGDHIRLVPSKGAFAAGPH